MDISRLESFGSLARTGLIVIPGYTLLLATLQLFGYWSVFGINPFSLLALQDIPRAAMSGLLVLLLCSFASAVFTRVVFLLVESQQSRHTESKRMRRTLLNWRIALSLIVLLGTVLLTHMVNLTPTMFPVTVSILVAVLVLRVTPPEWELWSGGRHSYFVGGFLVLIPFTTLGLGITQGHGVMYGQYNRVATITMREDTQPGPEGTLVPMGHLGEFEFFFTRPKMQVIRIPSDLIGQIRYEQVSRCGNCFIQPDNSIEHRSFSDLWE